MNIYSSFKYRVQTIAGERGEAILIKNRTCYANKKEAENRFNLNKKILLAGEKLVLESRDNKKHKFEVIQEYEKDN